MYLAGSWREVNPYFIASLTNIRENKTIMLTLSLKQVSELLFITLKLCWNPSGRMGGGGG